MLNLCAYCRHPRAVHHPDFGMCEKCNKCPLFVAPENIDPRNKPNKLGKKHGKGQDVDDPVKDPSRLEQ